MDCVLACASSPQTSRQSVWRSVAAPDEPLFGALLDRFYGGERDAATLALL